MSNVPLISDELRRSIGEESEVTYHEVERGAIKKILRALGDSNHLWTDQEVASKSKYREIVAPPAYFMTIPFQLPKIDIPESLKRQVGGGSEWIFFSPIRPGDVIAVKCRIADIYEKQGKQGNMLFIIYEVSYERKLDEKIAVCRTTLIRY